MQQAINPKGTETSAKPFMSVEIDKEPFNEFENNPALFYASFPHLFLLGKGLLQRGSLPQLAVRHLFLQYNCRSSQCLRLLFLLFDQLKRHAAAQTVAARVKTNPDSMSAFAKWISDKSFLPQLKMARKHPEAAESKEMLALITKHISLFETKIPFTASQRHGSMSHLLAMIVYLGFPSDFVTFAVDDIYGLHNIRTSVPQANNHSFPAVDSGLTETLKSGATTFAGMPISAASLKTLLASHPVQAAEVFRLIVNSLFAQGFGMPTTEHAKLTVPLRERRKGFAGTCTGAYGAMEDQKRGSLHMHCVIFGSLPTTLLQATAGIPFMKSCMSTALEKIIGSSLEPATHLRHLLNEIQGIQLSRPALFTAHNPKTEPDEFQKDVQRTVDCCNVHRHTKSCYTKNRVQCRYARPQPTRENMFWVQLQGTKKRPCILMFTTSLPTLHHQQQIRRKTEICSPTL
jgi:Helitron helicase-like domain at N-terminus